jgi:hypothetical protein
MARIDTATRKAGRQGIAAARAALQEARRAAAAPQQAEPATGRNGRSAA